MVQEKSVSLTEGQEDVWTEEQYRDMIKEDLTEEPGHDLLLSEDMTVREGLVAVTKQGTDNLVLEVGPRD